MRRCIDCAKWHEKYGWCPFYATWKAAVEPMCVYMRHEQDKMRSRDWMRAKAAKSKRKGAKRK